MSKVKTIKPADLKAGDCFRLTVDLEVTERIGAYATMTGKADSEHSLPVNCSLTSNLLALATLTPLPKPIKVGDQAAYQCELCTVRGIMGDFAWVAWSSEPHTAGFAVRLDRLTLIEEDQGFTAPLDYPAQDA